MAEAGQSGTEFELISYEADYVKNPGDVIAEQGTELDAATIERVRAAGIRNVPRACWEWPPGCARRLALPPP